MTEFRKKHPIVYGAVAVALGMAATLLVNWLFDLWIDDSQPSAIGMASALVVKLVPGIVAVAFLAATDKLTLIRPRGAGFRRGIVCGVPLLVLFCVMGLYAIGNTVIGEAEVNVPIILKALIYFLLVGVGEEFLARAVTGETLLEYFGLDHAGIVKACVVSGVIFGLMHVVNLFSGVDASSVAMQVLSTAGAGMFFGAIYFRCGNIWASVVLHMLWDASLFAATTSASFAKAASSSSSVGGGNPVGGILFFAFLVGLSLFLLRKSKTGQVQEAWLGAIDVPAGKQ